MPIRETLVSPMARFGDLTTKRSRRPSNQPVSSPTVSHFHEPCFPNANPCPRWDKDLHLPVPGSGARFLKSWKFPMNRRSLYHYRERAFARRDLLVILLVANT